jgi:hypothetical protein
MKNIFLKIFAGLTYVAMVIVNFLANSLPINNRSTGVISDAYPNLFAPAGFAFSIWGLIYLLLALYVFYQFILSKKEDNSQKEKFLKKINIFFIITSLANISWIFAWHYDFIGLSVLIMLLLLLSLIRIADILKADSLSLNEKIFIKLPFSIYFGWITVATIANITVFLVSIGWDGFGIADYVWTSIILLIGALIGILRMSQDKNIAYGLVLVWAYFGIMFKHLSASSFRGQYSNIITTVIFCLVLFLFFIFKIFYKEKLKQKINH